MRNTNENHFLHNERCPRCKRMGNDKAGDNLAIYSDEHAYCWSCGFYRPPTSWSGIHIRPSTKPVKIHLPEDCDTNYSEEALAFMSTYNLTRKDLLLNKALFSHTGVNINLKKEKTACNELLIFPFWNKDELLGWQGRYFGGVPGIPKWITRGKMHEIYHILPGTTPGNTHKTIVLVEAVISAIKVAQAGHEVMPLFGSHAKGRFKHLRLLGYTDCVLFLDPDKHMESIRQSREGSLEGLRMRVMLSDKKPKDYNAREIQNKLRSN